MSDVSNPRGEGTPRLLVSLATFNESGNLRPLVEQIRLHAPHASILVIDDNSPDGTGQLADGLRATLPEIHVIHRPRKLGLGTAILEGFRFAIENGYDYLLNLDADFSHPPRFIPALLAGMRDRDVMIGSRYIKGGGVEGGFNLKRKFMSTGINWYARLLLGLETKDNSGAFRCYRVSKLAEIDLDRVRSRGYAFQEEILFWCRMVDCRMGETPILFENRRAGVSKINQREAVAAPPDHLAARDRTAPGPVASPRAGVTRGQSTRKCQGETRDGHGPSRVSTARRAFRHSSEICALCPGLKFEIANSRLRIRSLEFAISIL